MGTRVGQYLFLQVLVGIGCFQMVSQLAGKAHRSWSLLRTNEPTVEREPVDAIPTTCHEQGPQDVDLASLTKLWIPGYPGSGSTMLRYLRETLTGLEGEGLDVYYEHCRGLGIGCKTHYPFMCREDFPPERFPYISGKYILLFRNPLHAIPSYYSFIHEQGSNTTSHTAQAPEEKWIEWRDENFDDNLDAWKEFFYYWRDNHELAMYLPYEDLISLENGEETFERLVQVYRETNPNVSLADDPSCLWRRYVLEPSKGKRSRSYTPRYSTVQYQAMIGVLEDLKRDFPNIRPMLQMYIDSCKEGLQFSLS